MSQELVIDIIQNAVMVTIVASAPPLIIGLVVGVIVSIFQAVTSIQEPTMAFVPKIVAVLFSLIIFGYFMLNTVIEYTSNLISTIPSVVDIIRN
ncbi:MAG: flagellar biosynthesis protein FliQ [Defluviitaleaceae bacterium]|nr:flagellar biosynthesis protein FliQ [Defluviitaleaceae bacterium]